MIRLGHATIELVQESLAAQRVDIVVNPANTYLWMKHGISGVLKREGGEGIEREAIGKGPIALGDVVLTGAGLLPCTRVAHAAVMAQDLKVTREAIELAVAKVLEVADAARAGTVAMPPLTAGSAALPQELVAAAMFEPMIRFLPDARHLRQIRVCVAEGDQLERYRSVLLGFFAG
jgi:O-acetyl-ADP-ribose deacetylase (regulator of RNase III)